MCHSRFRRGQQASYLADPQEKAPSASHYDLSQDWNDQVTTHGVTRDTQMSTAALVSTNNVPWKYHSQWLTTQAIWRA